MSGTRFDPRNYNTSFEARCAAKAMLRAAGDFPDEYQGVRKALTLAEAALYLREPADHFEDAHGIDIAELIEDVFEALERAEDCAREAEAEPIETHPLYGVPRGEVTRRPF